jgi:hypothetical protein
MILCLSAYTGLLLAVVNPAGLIQQALLYNKTPLQISYSVRQALFCSASS